MSKFYEGIMEGLQEALLYAKGDLTEADGVVVHHVECVEIQTFTPEEIKETRSKAKMTQLTFAKVIGVSKKSVEAWEGGRAHPDGSARRMIGLMKADPLFADKAGIIIR